MSGLDETIGTGDDYTIEIELVENCSNADIEVRRRAIDGPNEILGGCISNVEPIGNPRIQVHYRVVADTFLFPRLILDVDEGESWDVIFLDGFETGDLSGWP